VKNNKGYKPNQTVYIDTTITHNPINENGLLEMWIACISWNSQSYKEKEKNKKEQSKYTTSNI
jgi:hypothetical protein